MENKFGKVGDRLEIGGMKLKLVSETQVTITTAEGKQKLIDMRIPIKGLPIGVAMKGDSIELTCML